MPATIVFASFTGEEGGLLGSREFVRRAVAGRMQVVGALNNDMIGWTNDHRLDNTIRYSNPGIRDIQHAAAMLFTRLITYDALYFKGTDAASLYDGYGDVVGGIGSYPVLGSPHYHQASDLLEYENHQLITETSKTTVATMMLLASSPSRLTNLKVDSYTAAAAALSWTPAPEAAVTSYIVAYGTAADPLRHRLVVTQPRATLPSDRGGQRRVGEGGERARPRRMGLGQGDAWHARRLLQRLQPLFQARDVRIFGDEPLHDGGGAFFLTRRLERVRGQHAVADPKRAIVLRRLDAPQLLDRRRARPCDRAAAIPPRPAALPDRSDAARRRAPAAWPPRSAGPPFVRPARSLYRPASSKSFDVRRIAAANADASGIRVHQLAAVLAGFVQAEQPDEPDAPPRPHRPDGGAAIARGRGRPLRAP